MYPQPDDAHAAYPDHGAQLPAHHLPYVYDRRPAGTADAYQAYHYSTPARADLAGIDRARGMHTVKSIDGFAPPPPYPSLSAPGPSSEHSGDSDAWPDAAHPATAAAVHDMHKPKKPRRDKPRIALAPGQPPTTQGKPRARVYVACQQCRTRKIRCDGAKPVCHNCSRRTNAGSDCCNYDPLPKRRGPDKTPGARQRMARDLRNAIEEVPRRRRRSTRSDPPEIKHASSPVQQVSISIPDSRQYHSHVDCDAISLDISPLESDSGTIDLPTGSPLSHYSRSNYSQGSGHGDDCSAVQRPDLLGLSTLSDLRKPPVSAITNYRDEYGLVSAVPAYSAHTRGYITELDENGNERRPSADSAPDIPAAPSLDFSRKIWWDSLLCLYLAPDARHRTALSHTERESAALSITADLRFIFRASNYWFSFFHIPTFFSNYYDPVRRERIQPSLVLALLAMSTFWQSSEIGYGKAGRERALRFRDEAQAAMDASFNAGWIDETLAQAAWLLALFEVCAHPRHSTERSTSSMVMLDSIIRSLSLTLVDASDPSTTLFPPGAVPAVCEPSSPPPHAHAHTHSPPEPASPELGAGAAPDDGEKGCACHALTLSGHWPCVADHAPLWAPTPAWDARWSEAEIRKESCRRLCWSAIVLAAGHISYTTARRTRGLDLFISDPANYALLFSGESVARSPALTPAAPRYSAKETIWALHDRAFLLWHGCIRMRNDARAGDADKAQFAVAAWLAADGLEHALNRHTCSIERAFIFQAREYIFNTRMCISYEFRRYIPLVTANMNGLFHRNKAEEWLTHQAIVAERFMFGLHTVTGNASNLLARRPFFVFWFMGQIHRALALYECDSTLLVALDVCKALIPAIDYLTTLWPCAEQRNRYDALRAKVVDACYGAGVDPPPPGVNTSLDIRA